MSKIAIVTGGTRGIGEGIVVKLAQMGYNVTINYVSDSSMKRAENLIEKIKNEYNIECISFRADVADYAACKQMTQATIDKFGQIDVLVNNAGAATALSFLELTPEQYNRTIAVDLLGNMNCCHTVMPSMVQSKSGCIINISSIAGQLGYPENADYCASKAGIHGLTRGLAAEFAGSNIRVNAIAPGMILTDLVREHSDIASFEKNILLKRLGEVEDIADCVEYIIGASYVTGCVFPVNGGVYMN